MSRKEQVVSSQTPKRTKNLKNTTNPKNAVIISFRDKIINGKLLPQVTIQSRVKRMTGGPARVVFGETLWRHLCPSRCRNETPWKRSCTFASSVTHSSEDPLCRGSEKSTRAGPPHVATATRPSPTCFTLLRRKPRLRAVTPVCRQAGTSACVHDLSDRG